MKVEENQRFTSFDFISLVISLVVVVAISAPIVRRNFQADNSVDVARREISRLSETILNSQALNGTSRSIASVDTKESAPQVDLGSIQQHLKNGEWEGDIGKDPWGRPYHFAFLKNPQGMHTHVAIWSDGPNQRPDTQVRGQTSLDNPSTLSFVGDDVGFVMPVR